jgi:hypothetical protein
MAKLFKWTFWTFVALFVLSMALGTLVVGSALDGLQDAGRWHVVVDGETLMDDALMDEQLSAGGGIVAALVTGAVLLLVLPIVLIVGIGLPLLITAVALGAVVFALLGVSALIASPILLPILLIVWLARRKSPPTVQP